MRATLVLFNTHFWRSVYGPILSFVFPIIFLVVMGNLLGVTYVLPGIISMAGMFIGIMAMPLFVMEMKNSTLLKYVGSSPIDKKRFSLAVIVFYLLISFIAVINIIIWGFAFFWNDIFPSGEFSMGVYSGIFSVFGFFSFLFANLVHITLSLAIGLMIVSFTKTLQQTLTISLIIAIPSMFLSGMVIPVDIIAQSNVMQWVSRLSPFRYSTGLLVVSSTPLPQMGDFIQHISYQNLNLIFKNVMENSDGTGTVQIAAIAGSQNIYNLTSVSDLPGIMDAHMEKYGTLDYFYQYNIKDKVLFDQIFNNPDIDLRGIAGVSNNIFDVSHAWGVRKVPDTNTIMDFIQKYLNGAVGDMNNISPSILDLQKMISEGDMSWMELFTKQTTILYTSADMICNLVLPIAIVGLSSFVAIKKFKWSSR